MLSESSSSIVVSRQHKKWSRHETLLGCVSRNLFDDRSRAALGGAAQMTNTRDDKDQNRQNPRNPESPQHKQKGQGNDKAPQQTQSELDRAADSPQRDKNERGGQHGEGQGKTGDQRR